MACCEGTLDTQARDRGENMTKLIEEAGGFAEVFPEHKYEVVEVLQKGHHIVGMTGTLCAYSPSFFDAWVLCWCVW